MMLFSQDDDGGASVDLPLIFNTSAVIEPSPGVLASYSGFRTQAPSGEATLCFELDILPIGNTSVCICECWLVITCILRLIRAPQDPYYLQYLAWSQPDYDTPNYGHDYGNIAFQLISLSNDTLHSNSTRGLDPPIETTIHIPLRPLSSNLIATPFKIF